MAESLHEYAPLELWDVLQGLPSEGGEADAPEGAAACLWFGIIKISLVPCRAQMANYIYAALDSHSADWTDYTSASSEYVPATPSSHSLEGADAHVPSYIRADAENNGGIADGRVAEACGHTIDPWDLQLDESVTIATYLGLGAESGMVVRNDGRVQLDATNPWLFMRCVDCLGWTHFAEHLRPACITFWFPGPSSEYKSGPGMWWDESRLRSRAQHLPLRLEVDALERAAEYNFRVWKFKKMLALAQNGLHAARFHLTRWRRDAQAARKTLVRRMFEAGRGIVDTGRALVHHMDQEQYDPTRLRWQQARDESRAMRREWVTRKERWALIELSNLVLILALLIFCSLQLTVMAANDDDVVMPGPDEYVPTLAPDDCYTWAKAADLALRHIALVEQPLRHRGDASVEAYVRNTNLVAACDAKKLPILSYDAHVPAIVRVVKTPSFVNADIEALSTSLVRRPSDYLMANADAWRCPHHHCMFTVELSSLTHEQHDILRRATAGVTVPWTFNADGHIAVVGVYAREVVDIVALAHYEEHHFQRLGIRHVLHGQREDGRIMYHWEPVKMKNLLDTNSVRGSQARYHEEKCRVNMQRALAFEARLWAADALQAARKEEYKGRAEARKSLSQSVRANYGALVNLNLDRVDSLFEARTALFVGRSAMSSVVRRPMDALTRLHGDILNVGGDPVSAAVDRERCAAAREQQTFWDEGEGSERVKRRGMAPGWFGV
ncbi:hypothetical protein PENSPDRAFT_664729 [Peniophora sp. CONT]|nr:hypothetical protein PENSPDRAFT_664729 [Peniophora sp. CONT]